MAYYLSMQRVRFRSPDDYAQFCLLFSDVREHLKQLPGFIHLSWWVHPDDATWFNEISIWESKEAIDAWHNVGYHKAAKQWAADSGAIIEDVITNFTLESTRLLRICPCCHQLQDRRYDLGQEQKTLAEPCPKCGFRFPVMKETEDSFAVFKDLAMMPVAAGDGQPATV
jgi:heme-degrading monooxygenase HmoA